MGMVAPRWLVAALETIVVMVVKVVRRHLQRNLPRVVVFEALSLDCSGCCRLVSTER